MGEEGDYIIVFILHCHHHNDSCIRMDSDESRLNVSLGCEQKSPKDSVTVTDYSF